MKAYATMLQGSLILHSSLKNNPRAKFTVATSKRETFFKNEENLLTLVINMTPHLKNNLSITYKNKSFPLSAKA